MKELTEATLLEMLRAFREQNPHAPLWIRPTKLQVRIQASKKAWRTRKRMVHNMFHTKPWRGLFNKQQLPAGSVMLTVKASDGEELSVAVEVKGKDKEIMATFRALVSACKEYETGLTEAKT